jgi:hypothetical protein
VKLYGDYENVRRLRPKLWQQKNLLLHHKNAPSHTCFPPENFTKNNMTLIPHTPYKPYLAPATIALQNCCELALR